MSRQTPDDLPLTREERLTEMRSRGPVSAMLADVEDDVRLDAAARREVRYRVKAEAGAAAARVKVEDPKQGPVGVMLVDVSGRVPAEVSDVHVDPVGTLVCTITHRDIPAGANPFRFVNPPVCVRDADDAVVEDLSGAFAEMVADVVKSVVG